jgi:hypothetical protein
MSDIDITIGTARIVLTAVDVSTYGKYGTTTEFAFDDALHALARLAAATLSTERSTDVADTVAALRDRLARTTTL